MMKSIVKKLLDKKEKTMPILSFPAIQLLNVKVSELISSAQMQADAMVAIRNRCDIGVSLSFMDLSVEAEAFGAEICFSDDEIPTVTKGIIDDITEVESIAVPKVGDGRTGRCVEYVAMAKKAITDIPVFCGVIGPYSLAGRLFNMTDLMMECYDSPDEVRILLSKARDFIIEYIKAFKAAGADGVVMAEPAAGLLSPDMAAEFSNTFVNEIIDAVGDENFVFCYHNCGNAVADMAKELSELKADIFHFGNAISLAKIIPQMPADRVIMGNVDPVLLKGGSPDEVRALTETVFRECSQYDNFMLSTGCDIPAHAKWENIDAYFETVKKLYAQG